MIRNFTLALFASTILAGCAKANPEKNETVPHEASSKQPAPETPTYPTASDGDMDSASADAASASADTASAADAAAEGTPTAVEDTPTAETDGPPERKD